MRYAEGKKALAGLKEAILGLDQVNTLDFNTLCDLVKQCGQCKALEQGRLLHSRITASIYKNSVFVGNLLMQMYSKCGSMEGVCNVFYSISNPNEVSWTTMISAYAQNGHPHQALHTFRTMVLDGIKSDEVTMVAVFDACEDPQVGNQIHNSVTEDLELFSHTKVLNAILSMYSRCGNLEQAESIFYSMPEKNTISWNSMITAYSRNGNLHKAEEIFNTMPDRNLVSWTTMVRGYAHHGQTDKAFNYFRRLILQGERPTQVTFLSVLNACLEAPQKNINDIHTMVVESGYFEDVVVGSALLNVYGKHCNLTMARRVFEQMGNRNFVTWSSMIGAYSRSGASQEALGMLMHMDLEGVKPSNITFLSVVEACDKHRDAKAIHRRIEETCGFQSDTKLGNALVNMYGKCGLVYESWSVFDQIPDKSIVSWSIMIEVYATNKREEEALHLFKLMDLHGEKPQEITFTIVFDACASIPSLQQGRMVHSSMVESQMDSGVYTDAQLANSLINMFGKCASVRDARKVFSSMCMPDIISWTAMVTAYAENGEDHEALGFFQEMKLNGVKPNRITYLNVLSACSHGGLLEDGCKEFVGMSTDFGVEAGVDHYICLIDLLARSGRLEEAEGVIHSMPFEPDGVAWSTLLGGSRMHGDGSKASAFAGNACKYEDQAKHSATYVLLCETNRCRISSPYTHF